MVPQELLELLNKAAARLELLLASEVLLLLLAAVLLQLELLSELALLMFELCIR